MTILNLNEELITLEISGTDAAAYLQGQLTNDIKELPNKPFQYSAHLNNKGRILATFIVTSPAIDTYYLITSKTLANKIVPRLKMFILRSKVTLNISTKNISLSTQHLADSHTIQLAEQCFLNLSDVTSESVTDSNEFHHQLVKLGFPLIEQNTYEKIIPQQVNFDLIGGVNFKKGCYTGQEIVARTHYLGKVKRRMVGFSCASQPRIGQVIVSPLLDNQEVGFIIDYYQESNQFHGLASLQLDCLEQAYLDINNQFKLNCNQSNTESQGA